MILVRESSAKGAVDVVTGVKKLSRNEMRRGMEASFRKIGRERERKKEGGWKKNDGCREDGKEKRKETESNYRWHRG